MTDAEGRQLRIYAFLARENGIEVDRGRIVRGNQASAEMEISPEDAKREADRAVEALAEYRGLAGTDFEQAATSGPESCEFCPCIPFCESFWAAESSDWAAAIGLHVEGIVSRVEGAGVVTITLDVQRGTSALGEAVLEHYPRSWVLPAEPALSEGERVRVVHVRQIETDSGALILRGDRSTSSVWRCDESSQI